MFGRSRKRKLIRDMNIIIAYKNMEQSTKPNIEKEIEAIESGIEQNKYTGIRTNKLCKAITRFLIKRQFR